MFRRPKRKRGRAVLKRFLSLIFTVVIISNQLCNVASADISANYDENFYAGNDIVFYDPRCATDTAKGSLTLAGKDNLEKILNFLMRQGLTLAQASGIIGNFMVESGLNPAIIQGGATAPDDYQPVSGTGFGLAQWTSGGRQQGLVSYTKGMGLKITDLGGQLGFFWQELSGSYASTLSSLKAVDDPVQAAVVFHNGYEGSADSAGAVVANRGGNAARVYQTYVDAPALAGSTANPGLNNPSGDGATGNQPTVVTPPNSSPNGGCISDGFGSGNLQQTVVAYAWPQYAMRTDQMPAYTDAVVKAKSEGRYIGGYDGNDCGAFVTLLVRNSGFDTHYNRDGLGGNTIYQEAWLAQNWDRISSTDGGDRQPGDVAINEDHTYIYVGDVGGFGSKVASASLGDRAPMAGRESPTDSSFRWYRRRAPGPSSSSVQGTATGTTSGGGN